MSPKRVSGKTNAKDTAAAVKCEDHLDAASSADVGSASSASDVAQHGSASSASDVGTVEHYCVSCHLPVLDKDFVIQRKATASSKAAVKCGGCNRLGMRIRAQVSKDDDLKSGWESLSRSDKAEFLAQHHDTMGMHLKLAISQTIEHHQHLSQKQVFSGNSEWLDEADVMERFKNKPDQAEHLLKHAKSFVCESRGCKLYEVISYTSKASESKD